MSSIVLVKVASLSHDVKYAALSYCLGDPTKQVTTTTQTLQLHEEAIKIESVQYNKYIACSSRNILLQKHVPCNCDHAEWDKYG
jgi:hypothetical protein